MNATEECVRKSLSEMHRHSTVDFSRFEYPKLGEHRMPSYEIAIKIVLCSFSITASLFGNISTIYSILVKHFNYPSALVAAKFRMKNTKCSGGVPSTTKTMNRQCATRRSLSINYCAVADSPFAVAKQPSLIPNMQQQQQLKQHKNKNKSETAAALFVEKQSIRKSNPNIENKNNNNNSFISNGYNNLKYTRKSSFNESVKCASYKNTAMDFLVLNLSVSDLLIVLCCSWVHLINSTNQNWLLGAFFCKFNTFAQVVCLTAGISTLSVIAFERFRGIVLTSRKKLNRKWALIVILVIWAFSVFAAMPIFIYRKQYQRVWKNHVEIWCSDDWPRHYTLKENTECVVKIDEPLKRVYYTFISLVLFFIPILVMIVSYILIVNKLNNDSIVTLMGERSLSKHLLIRRRKKVNRLLMGLIITFTVCWTPVQIFVLFEAYKKYSGFELPSWFNWIYFIVFLLAYSNGAINPLIYKALSNRYKKEVKRLVDTYSLPKPLSRRVAVTKIVEEPSNIKSDY